MTPRIHNFFSLIPKHKLLLGSFIFLSLYTGALYTFATTYVSPGTVLDPLGIPGSYTVTPPLTYGGAVTSGHNAEILYLDTSGILVSDNNFKRNYVNQSTYIAAEDLANDVLAGLSVDTTNGNQLFWDADTTDDLSDVITQGQNLSGAGIDGTLIGHVDLNTQDHAISSWGNFTGQGGQAFQVITSVGSGSVEVGHTVSPANGYQIQYQNIGTNTTAHLALDGNANTLRFDADTTDTIIYGLEQDENILGLGQLSGSFNMYEDTSSGLVAFSGSGDSTLSGGFPATSVIITKDTNTGDYAGFSTYYDPGFPEMGATGQVVNGTNRAALILNSTDSNLVFSADSFTTNSGVTANSIAAILFRNDGTTQWMAGISDGMFEIKDYTNSKDYFKVNMTSGLYQLGDIDEVDNGNLLTIDDNAGEVNIEVSTRLQIQEAVTENVWFLVEPGNALVQAGDITGVGNSTLLTVDDANKTIVLQVDSNLDIQNEIGKKYFVFNDDQDKITIGDIDTAGNSTLFTVDDTTKTITGTSVISGTKNTSMKVGSIPGLSLPGSAFDYSDSVAGQSSSIGVGDFSGIGGNSNSGYMTWYTGATFAQSLLTTNSGGITGLVTDGTGATYTNEFNLGASGFTLSSTSGSYTFPLGDGTTDYVLATDGAGQLFWQDPTLIPSDQTLKSNIAPSTYGLSTLLQLNPVSYTLNANNKQQIGFIAQEVEPLIPELIGEIAGGKKGLAYGQLSAVIVRAIQELDLKLKPLEDLMTSENTFASVLRNWLANTTNGITSIFSKEVVTEQICVKDENGQTCLTRSQLDALISGGGSGSTSGGTGSTSGTTTGDSSSSGTTTDGTTSGDTTGLGDIGTTTGGDPDIGGTTTTGGGDTGIPL